jgi:hypothetical protein
VTKSMTRLRLRMVFQVDGLPIDPAIAGGIYMTTSEGDVSASIRLPRYGEEIAPGVVTWGGYVEAAGGISRVDLEAFEVQVVFPVKAAAEEVISATDQIIFERLVSSIDEAASVARTTALSFMKWVRVDQPWFGPSDLELPLALPASVELEGTGQRVPIGPTALVTNWLIMGGPYVTETAMGSYIDALRREETPSPASSLLSDALYLARWRTPRDYARGVLLAAIACEVRAKDVLLSHAPQGTEELLRLTLRRARSWELFDTLPKLLAKRSLKDEHVETHRRILRLFDLRNDIAHWARFPPDEAEVALCLEAAERAFEWLAEVEAQDR